MWNFLILLSSDCIRKTWLLSPVYQVLHQVVKERDTIKEKKTKKTRGKPKPVPRFAAGTSNKEIDSQWLYVAIAMSAFAKIINKQSSMMSHVKASSESFRLPDC